MDHILAWHKDPQLRQWNATMRHADSGHPQVELTRNGAHLTVSLYGHLTFAEDTRRQDPALTVQLSLNGQGRHRARRFRERDDCGANRHGRREWPRCLAGCDAHAGPQR